MSAVTLCYDYGPGCGLGHRRRMEALAWAIRRRGLTPQLRPLDAAVDAELLFVDSYLHRADDRSWCAGGRVAAIDDLDRDLAVDLLVDPIGASSAGRAHTRLSGLQFALVDPALSSLETPPSSGIVESVLVTTGGTDRHGHGANMAAQIKQALPRLAVQLVTGPWGAREVPPGVVQVDGSGGIAEALAAADIVVTAGGVTLLEAMRLGRPVVAVETAENQRLYLETASAAGAIVWVHPTNAAPMVAALAGDEGRRISLSRGARALIDGQGPERVARAFLTLG